MVGIRSDMDVSAGVLKNKVWALVFCFLAMMALGPSASARQLEVLRIRTHSDSSHTRVVLDLSGPADYEVFRQGISGNIFVRVAGAQHVDVKSIPGQGPLLRTIDPVDDGQGATVRLLLSAPVQFKHFFLGANDGAPNRVVVDLFPTGGAGSNTALEETNSWDRDGIFTVVIDPGHGGLDSGAVRGTVQEKNVVLDIARRLRDSLSATKGIKAVLTRESDSYPSLESRVSLAENSNGDILISIHCNTHSSPAVSGTEVYCQSLAGAQERKQDDLLLAGMVSGAVGQTNGRKMDDPLAEILLDVHMCQMMKRSVQLAENILAKVAADPVLKRRRIRQGQYKVLDSLSMPAALVEVAFMSNADELQILSSPDGRQKIADLLANAICRWKTDQEGNTP